MPIALFRIEMVLTESVLIALVLVHFLRGIAPKISTSWKKIAQIYLPDLPLFASLRE